MFSETITRNDLKAILDSALPSTAVDYIVEQGTDGDWTYRKWNSGIAECWGTKSESKALSSWGSWYYVRIDGIDYPTNLFTTLLNVTGSLQWAGGDLVSGLTTRPSAYNVTAPHAIGIRPNNLSGTDSATAFWYAVGKWK